jgi:hypothetical protein
VGRGNRAQREGCLLALALPATLLALGGVLLGVSAGPEELQEVFFILCGLLLIGGEGLPLRLRPP